VFGFIKLTRFGWFLNGQKASRIIGHLKYHFNFRPSCHSQRANPQMGGQPKSFAISFNYLTHVDKRNVDGNSMSLETGEGVGKVTQNRRWRTQKNKIRGYN